MSLKILYNIQFTGGRIFEVEFCDLSETVEKKYRYQWYLILDNKRYDLKFEDFKDNVRYFSYKDDSITLDINKKTLIINDNIITW